MGAGEAYTDDEWAHIKALRQHKTWTEIGEIVGRSAKSLTVTNSRKNNGKHKNRQARGEAVRADVERLIDRGLGNEAIAKELGIDTSVVRYRAGQLGVTVSERHTAKKKARLRKEVVERLKMDRGLIKLPKVQPSVPG